MAQLTITTASALGPLSVEVIGDRGARVGEQLTFSSINRQATLQDIPPGDYTVIGTRPSGEQLVTSTKVGARGGDAVLEMAGTSPREFLTEAAQFGLAYASPTAPTDDFRLTSLASPRASNTASRSTSVLLGKQATPSSVNLSLAEQVERIEPTARSVDFRLQCWRWSHRRWQPCPTSHVNQSDDYLQLPIFTNEPMALGLLGEDGIGPIVIAPPIAGGLDVTFLAAGVAMDDSADRVGNPSAVRVPVALAVAHRPDINDLLLGLNAAVLPNASAILTGGQSGSAEQALSALTNKFEDSAAAVLGALFLARFAPARLPIGWLRNLNGILPDVADTWLLLAWAQATQGEDKSTKRSSITQLLRRAAQCRCTFFGRSRVQLSKLALRYGPYPRAREEEVTTPRRARTGDYLDYAADAGGLEAFWGRSPTRPGLEAGEPSTRAGGTRVRMRRGKFVALS